jgi:hypothetical protein
MAETQDAGADAPAARPSPGFPTVGERPGRVLIAVAAAAVVVGVVARFVAPTPLWLDEALSVNIATSGVPDLFDALRQDGHPPLYYVLLWAWSGWFGTGDLAVRSLSGILGAAALWPAWALGRRRGGPVLGTAFVTVVAMSPFAIRYGSETRMYSLVMLLVLVGALLVDSIDHGRRGWRIPALAAVAAALVLSHYWGLILVGLVVLLLAVDALRNRRRREGRLWAAGALSVGALAFLPWVPTFLHQATTTGTPWAPAVRPSAAVGSSLQALTGGVVHDAVVGVGLFVVLAVIGLMGRPDGPWGISVDLRTRPGVRPEVLTGVVVLVVGSSVAFVSGSTFATRYAAVVAPLLLFAVAAGCCVPATRWIRSIALLAVCAFGVVGIGDQLTTDRTQAGQVGDAVAATGGPDRVVLACPDQLGPGLSRTVPEGTTLLAYPTLGPADRVDWQDYATRNAAADPGSIAGALVEQVADADLFVAWWPGYETFTGQCEALLDVVATSRGPGQDLVVADGDGVFEPMTLTWFPAP